MCNWTWNRVTWFIRWVMRQLYIFFPLSLSLVCVSHAHNAMYSRSSHSVSCHSVILAIVGFSKNYQNIISPVSVRAFRGTYYVSEDRVYWYAMQASKFDSKSGRLCSILYLRLGYDSRESCLCEYIFLKIPKWKLFRCIGSDLTWSTYFATLEHLLPIVILYDSCKRAGNEVVVRNLWTKTPWNGIYVVIFFSWRKKIIYYKFLENIANKWTFCL